MTPTKKTAVFQAVELSVENPEYGDGKPSFNPSIDVRVELYPDGQVRLFNLSVGAYTRAQWDALKALGDRAWTEYARRFPKA